MVSVKAVTSGILLFAASLPLHAATLGSLRLSRAQVTGCQPVVGTVLLEAPAPAGGVVVALSSDTPAASVPASVKVRAGATTKTFRVTTSPVAAPVTATISASTSSAWVHATVTLVPMSPRSVTLSPARVVGGEPVMAEVTLVCPAGPGDVVVRISSSKPTIAATSLEMVTVPQGAVSSRLSLATSAVQATTACVIGASAGGVVKSARLVVGPQIRFDDVTEEAGVRWSGRPGHEGFSLSWVDFNLDGLPDLWSLPHAVSFRDGRLPRLHINRCGGCFEDVFDRTWLGARGPDTHGSSWADFDRDGDPDVFVSVGAEQGVGEANKLLLVNAGGGLQDEATLRHVDYPLGRGRGVLWFDWNRDGALDLVQGVAPRPDGQAPTAIFEQTRAGDFEDRTGTAGPLGDDEARIVQLADLTGDGRTDLVICEHCSVLTAHSPPSHLRIYTTTDGRLRDVAAEVLPPALPEPKFTRDVLLADFNGDLYTDIFLSRSAVDYVGSVWFQGAPTVVSADLAGRADEVGISARSNAPLYFDLLGSAGAVMPAGAVYIGAGGHHPASIGFTLHPDDPAVEGIAPHVSGVDRGLYIGYHAGSHRWQVKFSTPEYDVVRLLVTGSEPITDLTAIGFTQADIRADALSPILLVFAPEVGRYVDRTAESGLAGRVLGQSAVAGDFDNDGDVDVLVSGAYRSFHDANLLYQNRGDGTFTAVPGAAGAAGRAVGPHTIEYGLAARLAVADYDRDGFLDIFSGPTNAETPTRTFLGEPPQLFRNLGNGNHWLEIDLEGTRSNRDGIGARVLVTAGGVTQLREQGGGMHHFAQDHTRLHFGLAANRRVQRLEVRWPSGTVQVMNDVAADRVLRIVEPSAVPEP